MMVCARSNDRCPARADMVNLLLLAPGTFDRFTRVRERPTREQTMMRSGCQCSILRYVDLKNSHVATLPPGKDGILSEA